MASKGYKLGDPVALRPGTCVKAPGGLAVVIRNRDGVTDIAYVGPRVGTVRTGALSILGVHDALTLIH